MQSLLFMSLAGAAMASPVIAPEPVITQAPKLPTTLEKRAGSLTTFYPTSCVNFEDPDSGNAGGCQCPGISGLVPYSTTVSNGYTDQLCPSTYVTIVGESTDAYPYTQTNPNGAVIAYATTADIGVAGASIPTGAATTIYAGTSILIEQNPTLSVNVGYQTEEAQRSALFTQVSNALTAGCPTPTSGGTVTACSNIPAITGVAGFGAYGDLQLYTDETINLSVGTMQILDMGGYTAVINAMARAIALSAANPNSTGEVTYYEPGDDLEYEIDWQSANFTNVPAFWQVTYSIEDESTNGAVVIQNMNLEMQMGYTGYSEFYCSYASLLFSGLAALGEIGELSYLGKFAGGSFGRFGISVGCDAINW